MTFSPIAIVGRGCLLPEATSAVELWNLVLQQKSPLGEAPPDRWRLAKSKVLCDDPSNYGDSTWSTKGGYIQDFQKHFDPYAYDVPAKELRRFDPLVHWTMHVIRNALMDVERVDPAKTGLVMGNLSFPSSSMSQYAESIWFPQFSSGRIDPVNRFMSGFPALLMRKAFGFDGPVFALDAACASALYAIKLACDVLHDGRADVMVAGAVNRADDLFIHVGFCALNAMSKTGQSRPFHAAADGLVPSEGAGMVVLKRLRDAERDGDQIFGVIRGIGLSNDGRDKGFLAPSRIGQVRALQAAYEQSGIDPKSVELIECHATGTPVGDATELQSMSEVFDGATPIGSLKSNLGHAITVAGAAGLIKVLEAMRHDTLPPNMPVSELNPVLEGSPFQVLQHPKPWTGVKRAGISAFGFGGNNAHLVVEAYRPAEFPSPVPISTEDIAIVGMDVAIGPAMDRMAVHQAIQAGRSLTGAFSDVVVDLKGIRFPPNDLHKSLLQQTVLLQLAQRVVAEASELDSVGVWIGMGTDPDVCRYGARWRVAEWAEQIQQDDRWVEQQRAQIISVLTSAGVLGTMPNIPANRLNAQFDFRGPSATISAEEGSGIAALHVACRALRNRETNAALVGAVDLASHLVHQKAAREVLGVTDGTDGAAVLLLKRLADAQRDGDRIYAVVTAEKSPLSFVSKNIGSCHAAQGLVLTACAAMEVARGEVRLSVVQQDMSDKTWSVQLKSAGEAVAIQTPKPPVTPLSFSKLPNIQSVPPKTVEENLGWVQPLPPPLPSVFSSAPPALAPVQRSGQQQHSVRAVQSASPMQDLWRQELEKLTLQHQAFVAQQHNLHRAFLQHQASAQAVLLQFSQTDFSVAESTPSPSQVAVPSVVLPTAPPTQTTPSVQAQSDKAISGQDLTSHAVQETAPSPTGKTLTREGLIVHSSGRISDIYGEMFQAQDGHRLQTRMPEPPLLLADRMTGLDAVPGSMKLGTIWTETDVLEDSWYVHVGRMPAGIMIESGQADLMLISYLGIDLMCDGDRSYRLLGCELMYHDDLPSVGDTLCYDIHVDGHARHGDVRLFFFHYDCRVNGQPRLTVRQGQAGFFTTQELEDSAGILWTPEEQEIRTDATVDPPTYPLKATTFSRQQVIDFAEGRPWACFGDAILRSKSHTRTPRIQSGQMLFLRSEVFVDPTGGPWGRGYLRCEVDIHPSDWYFEGHFKNDPCMPGTLMFEGCLQAMAFYIAAMGYTENRDGWRFQPVRNRPYPLHCRGQVTPQSKKLLYEVFIEECVAGPEPYVIADLLCTVDGLGAFHARGMGLELVPDHPLSTMPELLSGNAYTGPVAKDAQGFPFDYRAMMASALGKPSEAFGAMYRPFDGPRRVARLPGPPYHFMSRVLKIEGALGTCQVGTKISLAYDIPSSAWYFTDNGHPTMPFAVLLEAALQPCGWLASAVGSALTVAEDLSFRNLDGNGTLHCEVFPTSGTFVTHVTITGISQSAGMIIESFDVECVIGTRLVYSLQTVFGFFPQEALANQVGLPTSAAERAVFDQSSSVNLDLTKHPPRYFDGSLKLASGKLRMLDRITGFDATGGQKGLGWLRGEKDVDPSEWFFKAHFFQDPVQPGSLGIEAMIQLLQFYMIEAGLDRGVMKPRFSCLGLEKGMVWKYRGQVVPENRLISTTMDITSVGKDDVGVFATADASLWIDGKRIYEAVGMTMHIIEDQSDS